MFVEVICDMASIIDRNIQLKAHNSADYTEVDPKFAEEDFRERLKHYEKVANIKYCIRNIIR
jgi:hypothetical protein